MRIEEEVFARNKLIPDKLIDYGFKTENDRLIYTWELPDDGMKIIVEYDGAISGRIINLSMNDEYTAFRVDGTTGYSAQIRQKYIELLTDIRSHCCKNQSSCGPTSPATRPSDSREGRSGMPSWAACR